MAGEEQLYNYGSQIASQVFTSIGNQMDLYIEEERNALDRQYNHDEAALAREWSTLEREASQAWNLEQWNRENQYNSPQAQYERLLATGMNPNVAMSQLSNGNANGGLTTRPGSTAQATAPGARPSSHGDNMVKNMINSVNSFWQNKLLEKEVEGQDIENKYNPQKYEEEIEVYKNTGVKIAEEAVKIEQEAKKLGLEQEEIRTNLQTLSQMKVLELEQIATQISTLQTQIEDVRKSMEKKDTEIDLNKALKSESNSRTSLNAQLSDESFSRTSLNLTQDLIGMEDLDDKTWRNDFRRQFNFTPDASLNNMLFVMTESGYDVTNFMSNITKYRNASQFITSPFSVVSEVRENGDIAWDWDDVAAAGGVLTAGKIIDMGLDVGGALLTKGGTAIDPVKKALLKSLDDKHVPGTNLTKQILENERKYPSYYPEGGISPSYPPTLNNPTFDNPPTPNSKLPEYIKYTNKDGKGRWYKGKVDIDWDKILHHKIGK